MFKWLQKRLEAWKLYIKTYRNIKSLKKNNQIIDGRIVTRKKGEIVVEIKAIPSIEEIEIPFKISNMNLKDKL